MQTFMMLYVGLAARPTAEDNQTRDYNERWGSYMGELAAAGALESGAPFAADGKLVGRESVEPLELGEVDIGGYAIINAESLDAAVELAKRAPHIELGGTTIIRPCVPVGS